MDLDELRRLRRARDQMDREFAESLDVQALAETAVMSSGHFSRRFKEVYGETPHSYLMTRRAERAAALLRLGHSVSRACAEVGYRSLGSFSDRFKQLYGESPSDYRAKHHDASGDLPRCRVMAMERPRRLVD